MYGTGAPDPFTKIVKLGDNRFPCPSFISGDADFVGKAIQCLFAVKKITANQTAFRNYFVSLRRNAE